MSPDTDQESHDLDLSENSTEQFKVAAREVDLIDLAARVLNLPSFITDRDTLANKTGRGYISGAPSASYSLSSGLAAVVAANGAFYMSEDTNAKISNVSTEAYITQKNQFVTNLQSNVWTSHNTYNILNDWRYYSYDQRTYGLGSNTQLNNYVNQTYNYVRLSQTILRTLSPNLFLGLGYGWDHHYNITEAATAGAGINLYAYGITRSSTSAGVNLAFLFDDRVNSINPLGGDYVNVIYRPNLTVFGSDSDWQSLLIDARKYVPFPSNSENILAFWSYDWLTLSGKPPYLDLPSTQWDTYENLGRGYIQGRFRGKDLLYLEAEYRFGILRNGLLGGVVFANAQSVSGFPSDSFRKVYPAGGFGLRVKFNKYSRTNIAIDYGIGTGGSQGLFVNLGEVF